MRSKLKLDIAVFIVLAIGIVLASCSSTQNSNTQGASNIAQAKLPHINKNGTDASGTLWLCNPEISKNPCLSNLTTAVLNSQNKVVSLLNFKDANNPPIDCFYVYPTVSGQRSGNAAEKVGPAEVSVAIAQAAMFSRVCKVYAPIYRQVTVRGLLGQGNPKPSVNLAYNSMLSAFEDYIHNFNQNRGFVLIGHSQGAFLLSALIKHEIDNNPSLRKRLVSAILLGGNVVVPIGKTVGGTFNHVPECKSTAQTGCLIAYSSFPNIPPSDSMFGRTSISSDQVVCVNPSALKGGPANLSPLVPTHLTSSLLGEIGSLPSSEYNWVTYPNYLVGQCMFQGGASYLQITQNRVPGDKRLVLTEELGPSWGYHLYDMNLDLNGLVELVKSESSAFTKQS